MVDREKETSAIVENRRGRRRESGSGRMGMYVFRFSPLIAR
jgi:hypothetical protein